MQCSHSCLCVCVIFIVSVLPEDTHLPIYNIIYFTMQQHSNDFLRSFSFSHRVASQSRFGRGTIIASLYLH